MGKHKSTFRVNTIRAVSALTLSMMMGSWALALPALQWPSTGAPDPILVNFDEGNSWDDYAPVVVKDANDNNYVVVWAQNDGTDLEIYAQKISSANGSALWGASDVAITFDTVNSPETDVFGTNYIGLKNTSNGTFIAFDKSNGVASNIALQKLDVNGNAAWGANGLDIFADGTANTTWEAEPFILPDASGGVYVTWTAISSGFAAGTVYAAHVTSAGVVDVGPVSLTHGAYTYDVVAGIVSDGAGGVIIGYLSTNFTNGDVLALQLDSTLTPVGTWNGGAPSKANAASENPAGSNFPANLPQIISDGSGGAIVSFIDQSALNIRIQKFNSTGARQWLFGRFLNAPVIVGSYEGPTSAFLASDGAGGAYTVWSDSVNTADFVTGTFAQHFDNTGLAQWVTDGINLGDDGNELEEAIENRLGTYAAFENSTLIAGFKIGPTNSNIQEADTLGTLLLGIGGMTFGTLHPDGSYVDSPSITTDGLGGVVAVWSEHNIALSRGDIYAQYGKEPVIGPPPDAITDLAATDGAGQTTIAWTIPNDNGDTITSFTIEYGEVGVGFTSSASTNPATSCTGSAQGDTCSYNVVGLTNFTNYQFRVLSTNVYGDSAASNVTQSTPTPCSPLLYNDDSGGPTVSTTCAALRINAGALSFENIPDSFSFPRKFSTQTSQHSFGSDDPGTSVVDVTTTDANVLTVSDLRNSGGFDVTVSMGSFANLTLDEIPANKLYAATMYPEADDLTPIDPDLIGTEVAGIEFAAGSTSTTGATAPVHSANARGTASNATLLQALVNAYTTDGSNFDPNNDTETDPILLMQSTTDRIARMSQDVLFYLNIPANQPSGTYSVIFTIDLMPTGAPVG